jgi:HTH-type transcriptional regulator/antitoxin HigA
MEIRPIRSDADYRSALKEIERLWDAELGTAEADHVEVLSTLVEAYEAKYHPIAAPDPIAAIEFMMEQRGLRDAISNRQSGAEAAFPKSSTASGR